MKARPRACLPGPNSRVKFHARGQPRKEGWPLPMDTSASPPGRLPDRIVHVHIPKTAGTALAAAFRRAFGERLRAYAPRFEVDFDPAGYGGCNFFSGHIGYQTAMAIGGDMITVLRDPVDRFLSTYYFLRQLHASGDEISPKTSLAARHGIDAFVRIADEPALELDFDNRMAWQIGFSHRPEARRSLMARGVDGDELVRMAIANLRQFKIVGMQEDPEALVRAMRREYAIDFSVERMNVTRTRASVRDLPSATIDRIHRWVELDLRLVHEWVRIVETGVAAAV